MAELSLITVMLLFCLALSIESKKIKVMTFSLLVPYFWLMIALSRSVNRWVNINKSGTFVQSSAEAIESGNTVDKVVFLCFFLICVMIIISKFKKVSEILRNNKVWIMFYIYCALSIIWSEFAFISAKRFVKDLIIPLMVLVILTEPKPIEAFKAIIRRSMYLLVPLSIVFLKYFPLFGRYKHHSGTFTYSGVASGKNSLGILCLIGGLIFFTDICTIWKNRQTSSQKSLFYLYCFYFILIMYLFYFAQSMTSLILFLLGSAILVSPFLQKHILKIFIIGTVSYLTGLSTIIFNILEIFLGVVGRDITLTGRTDLWDAVLAMNFNPLTGTGHNSFWLGDRLRELWNAFAFHPKQAHNGYIEIYLNLGTIGLTLLIIALFSSLKKLTYKVSPNDSFWPLQVSFFTIFLLHNITEATFLFNMSPLWFMFLFIVFLDKHDVSRY